MHRSETWTMRKQDKRGQDVQTTYMMEKVSWKEHEINELLSLVNGKDRRQLLYMGRCMNALCCKKLEVRVNRQSL